MDFRVLVVDDRDAQDVVDLINGNKVLKEPDTIICEQCSSFEEALEHLKHHRYDLVTLDLKDDADESEALADADTTELAGEKLYQLIKDTRFIPIVFYSGYAYKIQELIKPFVRVVTRGEVELLRAEVKSIFDTKLPILMRHLEEEMRVYMWESVEKLWPGDEKAEANDVVYLIARRLANLLQGDVLQEFFSKNGGTHNEKHIHPVEMYVWPPMTVNSFFFGDILKKIEGGAEVYYVVLTPSCDLQQIGKAEFVIIGSCQLLADCKEAQKIKAAINAGTEIPSKGVDELKSLIKGSKDRLKFLPGTNFLPDLVLDLQHISHILFSELASEHSLYQKTASLDTPFAEALQSQLSRYYGRIGTPDLAVDIAYERAIRRIRN